VNTNDPIPTHGTVSLTDNTTLDAGLLINRDDVVVGARVYTYKPGEILAEHMYLDGSICAVTPEQLEHLANTLRDVARQLREARTVQPVTAGI